MCDSFAMSRVVVRGLCLRALSSCVRVLNMRGSFVCHCVASCMVFCVFVVFVCVFQGICVFCLWLVVRCCLVCSWCLLFCVRVLAWTCVGFVCDVLCVAYVVLMV